MWFFTLDRRLAARYKVAATGTIIAIDPEERELARGVAGKSEDVNAVLEQARKKYAPAYTVCESLKEAKERAASDSRPIVFSIEEEGKGDLIDAKLVKELAKTFIFARIVYKEDSEELKELDVDDPGEILVVRGKKLGSTRKAKTAPEIVEFLKPFEGKAP